ncbi:MAG: hypothetical protein IKN54_02250 [Lachnospiraceae bacterium]|nr:hypothetical protein [Lachnospiraceae bacterium]
MIYYKGTSKNDARETVIRVYDEPQDGLSGEYIAEAVDICRGNRRDITTLDDLGKRYYLSREITENEFNFFQTAGRLLTEIYMNQFTGGFPREKNVAVLMRNMRTYLSATLKDFIDAER